MSSYKSVGLHTCLLETPVDSLLPKLSPKALCIKHLWRRIRLQMLPSYRYPTSKYHFRSHYALLNEVHRQVYSTSQYIIHPLSTISLLREVLMVIFWFINLNLRMFLGTFYVISYPARYDPITHTVITLSSLIFSLNLYINFTTGYNLQHEFILQPKTIALNYLRTYFVTDLIDCIPIPLLYEGIAGEIRFPDISIIYMITAAVHCIRLGTITRYLRHMLLSTPISNEFHIFVIFAYTMVIFINSAACLIFAMPLLIKDNTHINSKSLLLQYVTSIHTIVCQIAAHSRGSIDVYNLSDGVVYTVVLMTAFYFHVFITVVFIVFVRKLARTQNKNETIMVELDNYIKSKKVPRNLRDKVILFYKSKFRNKYFRENFIINGLSEHLKYELFLHSRNHMLTQCELLHGLPRRSIGLIISQLEPVTYLPGELVFKQDQPGTDLYLVSHGTLAFFNKVGTEYRHYEDGEWFGCYGFMWGKYLFNVMVIEVTELFKWRKRDIQAAMAQCPFVHDRMEKALMSKSNKTISVTHKEEDDGYLEELRRGKIIEQTARRH